MSTTIDACPGDASPRDAHSSGLGQIDAARVRAARRAISLVFFANGAVFGSWAPHIAIVQERLGLSATVLGLSLLVLAGGGVVAMPITGPLVARFGSRMTTIVAGLVMCMALPLPVIAPGLPVMILGLAIIGAANGVMDVSMNAHGLLVETRLGKPVMSSMHGLFSLGGLLGSGLAVFLLPLTGTVAHIAIAAVILLCVLVAVRSRLLPTSADVGVGGSHLALPSAATFGMGALAYLAMFSEGSVLDWSAVYLRQVLSFDAASAALGFAAFSATMTICRLLGDRLRSRIGQVRLVRLSGFVAALGLASALLLQTPAAALAGFACMGIGLANVVPILFAAGGRLAASGGNASGGIAAVATMGYAGFLSGPPLLGLVADRTSLTMALGLVVMACLVVGVCASIVRERAPAKAGAAG